MPIKEIEEALDLVFLAPREQRSKMLSQLTLSFRLDQFPAPYGLLVMNLTGRRQVETAINALEAGAYLTTRCLLAEMPVHRNLRGCMYQLADSIRALSPLDIVRWHFVLSEFSKGERLNLCLHKMLKQSTRYLISIRPLVNNQEFLREQLILQSRWRKRK